MSSKQASYGSCNGRQVRLSFHVEGYDHHSGVLEDADVRSALTEEDTDYSMKSLATSSILDAPAESVTTFTVATEAAVKTPSVAKMLTRLLSVASNRKCADCGAHMVDSSQTFVSYSPSLDKFPSGSINRSGIGAFQHNHQAFAPDTHTRPAAASILDPALNVTKLLGGHGVFICKSCARAHECLGSTVATVKSVKDFSLWSLEQVRFLYRCGGNNVSHSIYEGFVPETWQKQRPSSNSTLEERLIFITAKYDALAFVTPCGGSHSERAWRSLVDRDKTLERYLTGAGRVLKSLKALTLSVPESSTRHIDSSAMVESVMPDRFVDFFCVVGHTKKLYPGENRKDLYALESPEGLVLQSEIIDCYPERDSHAQMEFPEHLSQFIFPDGCRASESQKPPALFTFVLTSSNGHRLYGAALRIYDETMETAQMKGVLEASGYTVPLPWWLSNTSSPPVAKNGKPARRPSDIIFLPKCLVVISHFAFFHTYRQFLKQLYQLSVLETPLPIERYIANFCSELPLPPQGKVEVKFGFTSDVHCTISRPAPNELPLAKFSYRPLFTALSVSNIMVVVGCLLQETRVALLSKHYSLLTPCSEALFSFLFPFEWQGMYIPIMPFSALDILDAPVPFLVGLHSRYLSKVKVAYRPKGVVYVDLDKDIVHLGFDESEDGGRTFTSRLPPALPEKDATKLKSKLQALATVAYIAPKNGIKGLITHGEGQYLQNSMSESYAQMEQLDPATTSSKARIRALEESESAYPDSQLQKPIQGFFSEEGQLSAKSGPQTPEKQTPKATKAKRFTKLLAKIDRNSDKDVAAQVSPKYLHCVEEDDELFDVSGIRNAFLRFMTSIFNNYDLYASDELKGNIFNAEAFLAEKGFPPTNREWMAQVLKTQMFQRFLEERIEDPNDAAALFFDESIAAKNNRSVKKTLKHRGKLTTPFLDDESWKVLDSFTPPAPSNWGLPADGRHYSYNRFPRLDASLFGAIRATKQWPPEWEQKIRRKGTSSMTLLKRRELHRTELGAARKELTLATKRAARGEAVPTLLAKLPTGSGNKNLNWALITLADARLNAAIELSDNPSSRTLLRYQKSENSNLSAEDFHTPDRDFVAHEMVSASRRKVGILILRIIAIQTLARKYIDASKFERFSSTLLRVNDTEKAHDLAHVLKSIILVQSCARLHIAVARSRRRLSAFLLIQRRCRGMLVRVRAKRLKSAKLLQKWWRGEFIRLLMTKLKQTVLRVQSVFKGRKVRFAFALVKNEIVKVQAQMRRHLVRKCVRGLLGRQVYNYKNQIFLLWTRAATPLSYRSQMWLLFKASYLGYRIAIDELERMWTILEIKAPTIKGLMSDDKVLCDMQSVGFSVAFEWKFRKVDEIVFAAQKRNVSTDTWFRGEDSDRGQHYAKRLQYERLQVYERLNSLDKTFKLTQIYELFNIGAKDKKKKARVIDKLWNSIEFAAASAKAVTLLFPELGDGIDIKQVKPSKKGVARLHLQKQTLLDPLDKALWVDRKMDHLYRKNMTEVAMASMQTMPDLCVKLHDASMRKTSSFERRQHARHVSQNRWAHWHDYKFALIRNYLFGEDINFTFE